MMIEIMRKCNLSLSIVFVCEQCEDSIYHNALPRFVFVHQDMIGSLSCECSKGGDLVCVFQQPIRKLLSKHPFWVRQTT